MKRYALPILIAVIALLCVIIGLLLGGRRFGIKQPLITEKTEISAHTVVKEVLPIGEFASLSYHYTTVVKDINSKDIKGWTIPFTTRRYIFTYDGTMKLGIDGTHIRVDEAELPAESSSALPIIRIILPPIKILSHEAHENTIEVFEQSQTIFNQIRIADAFRVTAERKRELEEKVMAGIVVKEAETSTEQQLKALFKSLPGIRDNYEFVFLWLKTDPSGLIDPADPSSPAEGQVQ
ncbi:MAG: DUF4230 domain-containing protein [Treponema sp.]|jgi:hypothetical protein|nr:DUF4230 domain-containing protein [Treponema sp.]